MEEITVKKTSWAIFKTIKELHLRDVVNVSIVGIKDIDGQFRAMPGGNDQIMVDSTILVVGTSDGIHHTKKLLSKTYKPEELKYV